MVLKYSLEQYISLLPEKLLDCSVALRVTPFPYYIPATVKILYFVFKYQEIQSNRDIYLNYSEQTFSISEGIFILTLLDKNKSLTYVETFQI